MFEIQLGKRTHLVASNLDGARCSDGCVDRPIHCGGESFQFRNGFIDRPERELAETVRTTLTQADRSGSRPFGCPRQNNKTR